jgi:hypothetical protein
MCPVCARCRLTNGIVFFGESKPRKTVRSRFSVMALKRLANGELNGMKKARVFKAEFKAAALKNWGVIVASTLKYHF